MTHSYVELLAGLPDWGDYLSWIKNDYSWRIPVHPGKVNQLMNGEQVFAGDLLRLINDGEVPSRREVLEIDSLSRQFDRLARKSPRYAAKITNNESQRPIVMTKVAYAYCPELDEIVSAADLSTSKYAGRIIRRWEEQEIIDGASRMLRAKADGARTVRVLLVDREDIPDELIGIPELAPKRRPTNTSITEGELREFRLGKLDGLMRRYVLHRAGSERGEHVAIFAMPYVVEANKSGRPADTTLQTELKHALMLQRLRLIAANNVAKKRNIKLDEADFLDSLSYDSFYKPTEWKNAVTQNTLMTGWTEFRQDFEQALDDHARSTADVERNVGQQLRIYQVLEFATAALAMVESVKYSMNSFVRQPRVPNLGNLEGKLFPKRSKHKSSQINIADCLTASMITNLNMGFIFPEMAIYQNLFSLGMYFSCARQGLLIPPPPGVAETLIDRVLIEWAGESDYLTPLYQGVFEQVSPEVFADIFQISAAQLREATAV